MKRGKKILLFQLDFRGLFFWHFFTSLHFQSAAQRTPIRVGDSTTRSHRAPPDDEEALVTSVFLRRGVGGFCATHKQLSFFLFSKSRVAEPVLSNSRETRTKVVWLRWQGKDETTPPRLRRGPRGQHEYPAAAADGAGVRQGGPAPRSCQQRSEYRKEIPKTPYTCCFLVRSSSLE